MNEALFRLVMGGVLTAQFGFGFIAVTALLKAVLERRPRWAHLTSEDGSGSGRLIPDRWLRIGGLSRNSPSFRERESLLAGCGFTADAAIYALARRAAVLVLGSAGTSAALSTGFLSALGLPPMALTAVFLLAATVCWRDKPLLEAFRQYRGQRIMRELNAVSSQLLYFAGTSMNLHVKLMRSVPYTTVIRSDLQRLLGEWYHDAGDAIRRFKLRIGTPEGAGFAETIEALRLHEDEAYYDLLKERVADYKIKLELARESRKESASYALFVFAGAPILYTFQIFIYPWVQEGQKLFQSLNS
ncbi:hypothetical protein BG53_12715 [Paenibacillus darwinianus]|uniref:Uncharacterized protein n=1 Tax=Paenibacillus darwinianus TaxID=1380763 RepID=A0A9W5S3K8_9BACL|nr:hypothetical protein [Paenibacillus darwinianus]EXX86067.1 hypothetical protein CH50_07965 [Paenibacillus darwinianus]EXX86374.1 hypothetical protein BG52_06635 [Paenibacillus darwinianus]EXX90877.1 hypothetical protein BG53_12715 [Paenibacillus darwinianus]